MAPPMMDGPSGFILLGPSPADEIAAEMDNTSLIPKTRPSPRLSASSSQPSRRYLNRELAAQFEDLRSVSKVAAPPRDFATHRERAASTRPRDSHSRAPKFIAVTDHSRRAETSSSATKSTQTRSTRTQPHDGSSDSESEDSSKTSKPSNSTPGPSGHGKPSMQPEGSSVREYARWAQSQLARWAASSALHSSVARPVVADLVAELQAKEKLKKHKPSSEERTDGENGSGGTKTGAKAEARKGANGEKHAKGAGEGSTQKKKKDSCTENGAESRICGVQWSDVKSPGNAEGLESSRQNEANEKAAGKRRAARK
nr:suppressor protein SRP40-like [Rhipicephalus microplus]